MNRRGRPGRGKSSKPSRLSIHAHHRWPQIQVEVRFRGGLAYLDGHLPDGDILPLCRLRYGGYANDWGFAIYRASYNDYQESYLPTGYTSGTAEEALDTACGLYLNDPTAWITKPPTN